MPESLVRGHRTGRTSSKQESQREAERADSGGGLELNETPVQRMASSEQCAHC